MGEILFVLKLYDMFCNDTLRHRDSARKIVELINKQDESKPIVVDFDKIDFVSRSFLHELLCGVGNRTVSFSNANNEITQMTNIIQKNSVCVLC